MSLVSVCSNSFLTGTSHKSNELFKRVICKLNLEMKQFWPQVVVSFGFIVRLGGWVGV